MKKVLVVLAILLFTVNVAAEDAEFDLSTSILTIPTVNIGSSSIYDVKLQMNGAGEFIMTGYSPTPSTSTGGSVLPTCTSTLITLEKYNQIQDGMTLDQANSIMGCEGTLYGVDNGNTMYEWQGDDSFTPLVHLGFDANGSLFYQLYMP